MGEEMNDGTGRATVKQVYDAVDSTRVELSGKIDKLGDKLDNVVVAHEHRLTELETAARSHSEQVAKHETRLDNHDTRIASLESHKKALTLIGSAVLTLSAGGLASVLTHVFK